MTREEVIGLLESGVDSAKVAEAAKQYGISFAITDDTHAQLLDAGATDELIEELRKLGPKPTSASQPGAKPSAPRATGPAVLLLEVMPGGGQVYVDDEPTGTTSQAGRLKLSQLQPGTHQVRVSLAGHRDFEQSVVLVAGQTSQVTATLQSTSSPAAANPLAASRAQGLPTGQGPASSDTATLGVLIAPQAPPGWQGIYVTAVAPGGPAEAAGLRAGHAIVSVNGQPVYAPQDLMNLMGQFQPGQTVQIAYTDGATMQTAQARLVGRSSLPAPSQVPSSAVANPLGATQDTGSYPVGGSYPQAMPVRTFSVAHDHGSSGSDYCVGTIAIGGGMLEFRSATGAHSFQTPVAGIKDAKKNAVYLAFLGAFHVRLKNGTNFNFVVLDAAGQYQPPNEILDAIAQAMGK